MYNGGATNQQGNQMVKRYHPPVVNDEAPRPEYVEMSEATHGRYVEHDDYEMLRENQALLRDNARRMMKAVKNSCLDIVTAKLVNTANPEVRKALEELEAEMKEISVDFSIFQPRQEF
jgi:hypothetical protein